MTDTTHAWVVTQRILWCPGRPDSDYRVTLTEGPASNLDIPEYQRDPADRRSYLQKQGPWMKALEGVLDVVKRPDGSLMVLATGAQPEARIDEVLREFRIADYQLQEEG